MNRLLSRLSGEPDLASDLAQETFARLYRRGSLPDAPAQWLVSVALNLFRNLASMNARRRRLLTVPRGEGAHSDEAPSAQERLEQEESRRRVRSVLEELSERDRQLLLMRAEGYNYREIATALGINESSIGTLLARAKRQFREVYGGSHASR